MMSLMPVAAGTAGAGTVGAARVGATVAAASPSASNPEVKVAFEKSGFIALLLDRLNPEPAYPQKGYDVRFCLNGR
jgi:hypothetical protein